MAHEITKWYNKWVTNGYFTHCKQLYLDCESYTEL